MENINKDDFKSSPSRRRESYISKNYPELYNELLSDKYNDFETFSDKINKFVFGGGYCVVCNIRTKKETGKPGFRECCSTKCAGINKQGISPVNKSVIDEDLVKEMYENNKSPKEIGEYFNVSNVTINKIIDKLEIKRSHSEQQKIHSLKGRVPWNCSGIKHYDFNVEKPKSAFEISKKFNVEESVVYLYSCRQNYKFTSKSYIEDIISEILDELGVEYTQNRKNVIYPLEVDFYIPKYKIAIECNGLYHHCAVNKERLYHYNKFMACQEKGIHLIQFWEDTIRDEREKIKSYLKSKFNLNSVIYARKCKMEFVSSKDAMNFYNLYHLQGSTKNGKHIGLYYENELVCCMSFTAVDSNTYELTRFCAKSNITVVGGFNKLLKSYSEYNIVSYSNNDYSEGNVYFKNGFEKVKTNTTNMLYTDLKHRYNRERFMKKNLKKLFPHSYCDSKTEKEILEENKIYQCIGSGTVKWYKSSTIKKALN